MIFHGQTLDKRAGGSETRYSCPPRAWKYVSPLLQAVDTLSLLRLYKLMFATASFTPGPFSLIPTEVGLLWLSGIVRSWVT